MGALGLPWGPNVTPRKPPRGSGEDLGSILDSLGALGETFFTKKYLFGGAVLGGLLGQRFLLIFHRFWVGFLVQVLKDLSQG